MLHKEKKLKFLILISKYRYKSKTDLDTIGLPEPNA